MENNLNTKTTVIITVTGGIIYVDQALPGITVVVRDYDVDEIDADIQEDENGMSFWEYEA